MIQKLILKLKQHTKLSDEEIVNGRWFCNCCDCSINGMMDAVEHGLETKHSVFPIKILEGILKN